MAQQGLAEIRHLALTWATYADMCPACGSSWYAEPHEDDCEYLALRVAAGHRPAQSGELDYYDPKRDTPSEDPP